MVRLLKLFIFSIMAILLANCTLKKDLIFFNADQILEQLRQEELVASQLPFDLINLLYLDTGLAEKLREVAPAYMSQKNIDLDLFQINEMDKSEIDLVSKYASVKDILAKPDDSIKSYLKESFGIEDSEQSMSSSVLLLNDKAFVEFRGEGSVYAITLELLGTKKVKLGIAYINLD